jgi:hemolysin III
MTSVMFPQYTLLERIADGCIHVVGVAASLVALTVLLIMGVQAQATLWIVAVSIYGLALVAMFTCSAGYNLIVRPKVKAVFRRLDHAAIFIMIAGTYTPFALMKMDAKWGLILLAVVWSMAAIGVAIKLFAPRYLEGATTGLYLVQGWAVIVAWHPLVSAVPQRVAFLLMLGGVLYTVGVVFHLWERLPFQNAIWHGFVLVAASVHFAAVVDILRS